MITNYKMQDLEYELVTASNRLEKWNWLLVNSPDSCQFLQNMKKEFGAFDKLEISPYLPKTGYIPWRK